VLDYLLLFLTGLSAGFIDSVAGGGGLITMPVLLAFGLPPHLALGTNKAQSTFGTALAVWRYFKAGIIPVGRLLVPAVIVTFIAALAGTWAVTQLPQQQLRAVIPWLLLGIAIYTLVSPGLGDQARSPRLKPLSFALLFGSLLGFYDGFFGPGTGAFWTIACISLLGLTLPQATAYTKVVNLTSNIAALLLFAAYGHVRYDFASIMVLGQLLGAQLGSGLAIKHGAPFIRPLFITVVLALVARLLWQSFTS
jgi:uncharacterized membrane protein YfcA